MSLIDKKSKKTDRINLGKIPNSFLFYFRRCGHTPVATEDASYMTRLRENSKQLFSIIIDDSSIQTLLSSQTIEEVIVHVLKLAQA